MKENKSYDIVGGKILIFGDLHLSSTYQGQHKNYLYECYKNMDTIISKVEKEKAGAVIFLGDLIGVNEYNLRDRQVLMRVVMFFSRLNDLTGGNVYSVKGNHDIGDFSDFDFLIGLNLIKNPRYINYYGTKDSLEIRFHLVNYGDEHKPLYLSDPSDCASNVVLGHADYFIEGVTNWFSAKSGVELSKLGNFCGVEYVFSGHIHIPSEEILYTNLRDGSSIGLFYTGSPSRVADRYLDCWYLVFEYLVEEQSTEYDARFLGLIDVDEAFYPKEDFINDEENAESVEESVNSQALTDLVREIIDGRITSGDIESQIRIIPGVDDETKELAISYYRKALMEE